MNSLSNYGLVMYYVNKCHPLLSISFSFQMDSKYVLENINKKIGNNDEMNMDLEFNLIFFSISLIKLAKDDTKIPNFGSQKKEINVFVSTTTTFMGFNFNIF